MQKIYFNALLETMAMRASMHQKIKEMSSLELKKYLSKSAENAAKIINSKLVQLPDGSYRIE